MRISFWVFKIRWLRVQLNRLVFFLWFGKACREVLVIYRWCDISDALMLLQPQLCGTASVLGLIKTKGEIWGICVYVKKDVDINWYMFLHADVGKRSCNLARLLLPPRFIANSSFSISATSCFCQARDLYIKQFIKIFLPPPPQLGCEVQQWVNLDLAFSLVVAAYIYIYIYISVVPIKNVCGFFFWWVFLCLNINRSYAIKQVLK